MEVSGGDKAHGEKERVKTGGVKKSDRNIGCLKMVGVEGEGVGRGRKNMQKMKSNLGIRV